MPRVELPVELPPSPVMSDEVMSVVLLPDKVVEDELVAVAGDRSVDAQQQSAVVTILPDEESLEVVLAGVVVDELPEAELLPAAEVRAVMVSTQSNWYTTTAYLRCRCGLRQSCTPGWRSSGSC